ncbi:MAG: DUF2769 domain-containing protein [Candidatus Aminicenantes bacterium]|nr:DUF2769 domain-containing protein [Candidatus Aminicenantes bacterium]
MKRRDFFEKSGCGLFGLMLAFFGLTACKKGEAPAEESAAAQAAKEEMSQKDMIKKLLMEKKGLSAEEADAQMAEFEEKVSMVKTMCICRTCPTYVSEESELGFCHPLVGKSKVITGEKGCVCPNCPVYKQMSLKNGYYCTRKSEMEQEMAKIG